MKQLKERSNARHLYIIDALRYTLLLERKAYRSLRRALKRIENNDELPDSHPSEDTTLSAVGSAWAMVDMISRARSLVRQVPKLSQNEPEIQVFLRHTYGIEYFRNLFQHLDSEISKIYGEFSPIMGAISWVTSNPDVAFTIAIGTSAENTHFHTLAVHTSSGEFSENMVLTAGNADIELGSCHIHCERIRKFFDDWLEKSRMLVEAEQEVGIIRFNVAELKARLRT